MGSIPNLKARRLRITEVGIEMVKVIKMESKGIPSSVKIGIKVNLIRNKFNKIVAIPIREAVTIEREKVAKILCNKFHLLNSPTIKSRDVLAMKGPLKLPLKERRAGIIRIKRIKLSNGRIKTVRTIPASISPTIEIISEGNVCLTIFPFES